LAADPDGMLRPTLLLSSLPVLVSLLVGLLVTRAPAAPADATGAPGSPAAAAGRASAVPTRSRLERRVVELTNAKRKAHGCAGLDARASLRKAARRHSTLMARREIFLHELPGEPGLAARIRRAGYTGWDYAAENIAVGYSTPRGVVRAWMGSPGHRANILDCGLEHIGVGLTADDGVLWWTQDLGRR
jgi:uncharacterized protein YkwD